MTYKEALNAQIGEVVHLKGMSRNDKIIDIQVKDKVILFFLDDGFTHGWKHSRIEYPVDLSAYDVPLYYYEMQLDGTIRCKKYMAMEKPNCYLMAPGCWERRLDKHYRINKPEVHFKHEIWLTEMDEEKAKSLLEPYKSNSNES